MVKVITITLAAIILSGCYAAYPISMAVNRICTSTYNEKALLAEKFDEATMPHQVRVRCNAYQPTTDTTED